MSKENAKIKSLRNGLTIFEVIIVVLIIFTILWLFLPRIPDESHPAKRIVCLNNMKYLNLALSMYANDYSGAYPTAEKWCDLVKSYLGQKTDNIFRCPGAKEGNCHYAINPNCEPNSPQDTVLLFETKGGWNQSGGPELLTTENHRGDGCIILFNDGSVDFVKKEEITNLKWNTEENNE